MKTLWLLLTAGFFAFQAKAQIQIGYKVGYWNPTEINRIIYLYNEVNDNDYVKLDKRMQPFHINQGISVGIGFTDEDAFAEMRWSNRHSIVSSTSLGNAKERILKLRSNFIEMGFGHNSKDFRIGVNLGIGTFKGFGKITPSNPEGYMKLFQESHKFLYVAELAFTPYVQYKFAKIFGLRLYYQYMTMGMDIEVLDKWMLGNSIIRNQSLESKASNIGLELNINLGGYNNN